MTTLSVSPDYPAPNRQCRLVFNLTESGSNFVRVWVTAAPEDSSHGKELRESGKDRIPLYDERGGTSEPHQFTPEAGGKYTFVAQEYTYNSGAGASFEGDPRGGGSETKVGIETTLSFYVGQRVVQTTGVDADKATIAFWVWNDTVRQTRKGVHGEDSPRVFAENPSGRARAALESASVETALANLVNQTVTAVAGNLGTLASNFLTRWNAHVADATVHEDADSENGLAVGRGTATGLEGFAEFVSAALAAMRQHYMNDNGEGVDSGNYHNVAATKRHDWPNMPLLRGVGSPEEAYVGFAEVHRSYELHRVSTAVHDVADATALATLPLLMLVHKAFLQVLADTSATPPPAQSQGVMTLIQVAGCREEPLPP